MRNRNRCEDCGRAKGHHLVHCKKLNDPEPLAVETIKVNSPASVWFDHMKDHCDNRCRKDCLICKERERR